MRLMIALLAGVVVSLPASAGPKKKTAKSKTAAVKRAKSKFKAGFLSYNQLLKLPKAKRMEYIRDIAELIVRMERAGARYEIADNGMSLEDIKYKFAIMQPWLQILPQAEAREYSETVQGEGNGEMTYHAGIYYCGPGYKVDLSIPGCLKLNDDGTTMFSSLDLRRRKCDGQPIPHPNPNSISEHDAFKGCMSDVGFGNLSERRREAILSSTPERDVFLDPNAFLRMPRPTQMAMAYGGNNNRPPSSESVGNARPAGDTSAAAPSSSSAVPAPAASAAPAMSNAEIEAAVNNAASASAATAATEAPAAEPVASSPESAAAALGGGAAPLGAPTAAPVPFPAPLPPVAAAAAPAPEPQAPAPEDPKADACIPEPTTCQGIDLDDEKTKLAINDFRKNPKWKTADGTEIDSNICISGGFPARYSTPGKKAGTCRGPSRWGPATCKANEVVCNPVLFCHTAKSPDGKNVPQWFCVEKKDASGENPQFTALCDAEFQKRLNKPKKYSFSLATGKKGKDGQHITEVKKTEGQVAIACDPESIQINKPEFKKAWDDMVAALKQLSDTWCGSHEVFKALFCRECQLVTAHIYRMNKKATGSGCAPPADSTAAPAAAETTAPKDADGAEGKKD